MLLQNYKLSRLFAPIEQNLLILAFWIEPNFFMKKDILFPTVQGVYVTVVCQSGEELDGVQWQVYLINRTSNTLTNIFVTSRGYLKDGEIQKETSTLRHYFAEIGPNASLVIEPIMPDVFHLNNEYWVSYYLEEQVFDKKFIFVPDSIVQKNLVKIPELNLLGVLHE